MLLCVLLDAKLRSTRRAWLIPLKDLALIAYDRVHKFVIRPSISETTQDRYKPYQCLDMAEVATRLQKYDPNAA